TLQPAEQDVARGLHEPLSLDHPAAVVGKLARTQEALKHRGSRFLELQEQRILLVAATLEQQDPAARADRADANDLVRDVHEAVALEEPAAVVLEAGTVSAEQTRHRVLQVARLLGLEQVGRADDHRRVADDPKATVD